MYRRIEGAAGERRRNVLHSGQHMTRSVMASLKSPVLGFDYVIGAPRPGSLTEHQDRAAHGFTRPLPQEGCLRWPRGVPSTTSTRFMGRRPVSCPTLIEP